MKHKYDVQEQEMIDNSIHDELVLVKDQHSVDQYNHNKLQER